MYLLDTNTISDVINDKFPFVAHRVRRGIAQGDYMFITPAVYYESMRGLIYTNATRKIRMLHAMLFASVDIRQVIEMDWMQAAEFHAFATRGGYAFSDIDLLLAAVAYRLQATLVSSDKDFSPLPVIHEDWRTPPTP